MSDLLQALRSGATPKKPSPYLYLLQDFFHTSTERFIYLIHLIVLIAMLVHEILHTMVGS